MDLDNSITRLNEQLQSLGKLDIPSLDKLNRELTVCPEYQNDSLLKTLISFLNEDDIVYRPEHEALLKVFDNLSDHYDFDTFDSRICALNQLIRHLDVTGNSMVFASLLRLVMKLDPIEILANTDLFKVLLKKLSSETVSVRIVSGAEKLIYELSQRDELFKRRLLSNEVVSLLLQMRNSTHLEVVARLMDLLVTSYLGFLLQLPSSSSATTSPILPAQLFQFSDLEILNDDFMYPATIVQFYCKILHELVRPQQTVSGNTLIEITTVFTATSTTLHSVDKIRKLISLVDVEKTAQLLLLNDFIYIGIIKKDVAEMVGLYSKCLYIIKEESAFLHQLMSHSIAKYVEEEDQVALMLLAHWEPSSFLARDEFVANLSLNAKNLAIVCNLLANEQVFNNHVKSKVTTQLIRNLGPLNVILEFLIEVVRYSWSADHLLNGLPSIMNLVLDAEVTNQEILVLRQTFVNRLTEGYARGTVWEQRILELADKNRLFLPIPDVATMFN